MKRKIACNFMIAVAILVVPLAAAGADFVPGLYAYTIKMNMPGMPANMPAQTMQHCITTKDVATITGYGAAQMGDNDCRVMDMVESGGQFSYKISCSKPQKIDGAVKGNYTATSVTMDMTMSMQDVPGTITQSTTARRVGDCKQ